MSIVLSIYEVESAFREVILMDQDDGEKLIQLERHLFHLNQDIKLKLVKTEKFWKLVADGYKICENNNTYYPETAIRDGLNVNITNTVVMKTDVGNISGYLEKLRQASGEIETILSTLSSSWEGEAAAEFERRLKEDIEELEELIEALTGLNGGTDNARQMYETCESNVADIIAQIKV